MIEMTDQTPDQATEFMSALIADAPRFKVEINAATATLLSDYYAVMTVWNPRLHLVAPCTASEFAVRHVIESLAALPHIPPDSHVIDIGSGGGLPIIPCLVARPDITATLFESSPKKTVFLREALRRVNRYHSASVVAERFERAKPPAGAGVVTCRALDRFGKMFDEIVAWSPPDSTLLLFGGYALREQLERAALDYTPMHLPDSAQRFLFVVRRD